MVSLSVKPVFIFSCPYQYMISLSLYRIINCFSRKIKNALPKCFPADERRQAEESAPSPEKYFEWSEPWRVPGLLYRGLFFRRNRYERSQEMGINIHWVFSYEPPVYVFFVPVQKYTLIPTIQSNRRAQCGHGQASALST